MFIAGTTQWKVKHWTRARQSTIECIKIASLMMDKMTATLI